MKKGECKCVNPETKNLNELSVQPRTGFLRRPIFHALLIALVGLFAYSNTFHAPFHFDDIPNIVDNPIVKDFKYFAEPPAAKEFALYDAFRTRFIGYLTFALNYSLHDLDVPGYHIANLAIHIINALLVYLLGLLTFKTPYFKVHSSSSMVYENTKSSTMIAFFSALLFISHPIQTQAVTYIVQRLASLATMFYLLSLVAYINCRLSSSSTKRYSFYAVSLISAVLAMKTKEIAFTLPVIIVLYELMFFGREIKKRILYLIPILLTLLIIPLTLLGTGKPVGNLISDMSEATRVQTTVSRLDYLFTQFRVIVTYIRLLFLPINQNLDYDYPIYHSFFDPGVFMSFLLLLSLCSFAVYLLITSRIKRHVSRLIAFGIFWFFITLTVESSIIPIVDVMFEHRVYLPSVGAFMAITTTLFYGTSRIKHTWPQIERAIIPAFALVVIVLSGTTYARNIVWRDEVGLWEDVVKNSPENARGHNNLGLAYSKNDWIDKGMEHFQIAARIKPNYMEAHFNLGLEYFGRGRTDMAQSEFEMALKLKPDDVRTKLFLNYTIAMRSTVHPSR